MELAADQRGDEQTLSSSRCRGRRSTAICRKPSTGCREAFRQAVWLRDVEEFSYAEIARIVDVPIGTVMSRISRGRRSVRAAGPETQRDRGAAGRVG